MDNLTLVFVQFVVYFDPWKKAVKMWSLMMRLVKDKAVSVHLCAYISFYDFYACFNLISWSILRLQIPKRSSSFCLCFVPV